MKPRFFAARVAARVLLRRIWFKSGITDPHAVLGSSLDLASRDLMLTVEHVPVILGDNQIAGVLNRLEKRIQLATKFRHTSQRFTCAHEIAHFILHPGTIYFRDRELSAPGIHREYFEIEADAFAAEFLMPRKFLDPVFRNMFGGPIDGTILNPDLVIAVGTGVDTRTRWTPEEFTFLSPLDRAAAIASAHTYKGRFFASLTDQFNVSQKAMGIQLLQMGLVK
ncbi:MAG: ImmA/IrrE family metallo-endopeptidase [Verrucomicrobiales bacterium]|nr:ImmA/IrrE family metallo-endopeptidase [Verrucomicrobiales bacterium]